MNPTEHPAVMPDLSQIAWAANVLHQETVFTVAPASADEVAALLKRGLYVVAFEAPDWACPDRDVAGNNAIIAGTGLTGTHVGGASSISRPDGCVTVPYGTVAVLIGDSSQTITIDGVAELETGDCPLYRSADRIRRTGMLARLPYPIDGLRPAIFVFAMQQTARSQWDDEILRRSGSGRFLNPDIFLTHASPARPILRSQNQITRDHRTAQAVSWTLACFCRDQRTLK